MGIYSSFDFPNGVTLFGSGRQYSFDIEEPAFGEVETVVETEIEPWLIPVLGDAYGSTVGVKPIDAGGQLRLPDAEFW